MKTNMGTADRIIRILVALAGFVLFFTGTVTGTTGIILVTVAGVFLVTGFLGFCPLYRLIGVSTCRTKKHDAA